MSRTLLFLAGILGAAVVATVVVGYFTASQAAPDASRLGASITAFSFTAALGAGLIHVPILLGLGAYCAARPSGALLLSGLAFFVAVILYMGLVLLGIVGGPGLRLSPDILRIVSIAGGLIWLGAWVFLFLAAFLPLRHRVG